MKHSTRYRALDDRALVGILHGDEPGCQTTALGTLFERYSEMLHTQAFNHLQRVGVAQGDTQELAEDIVVDLFVDIGLKQPNGRLFQAFRGFECGDHSFCAFLRKCCHILVVNCVRKRLRHRAIQLALLPTRTRDDGTIQFLRVEAAMLIDSVEGIDQELLSLYLEGHSHRDIALKLGITHAACRQRWHRLLDLLRRS